MARYRTKGESKRAGFQKDFTAREVIARVVRDTKHIRLKLLFAISLMATSIALASTMPKILGSVIEDVNEFFKNGNRTNGALTSAIKSGVLILACLYFVNAVVDYFKMRLMSYTVSRHFTYGLRVRVSAKINRLPIKFVDNTAYGEFLSIMNEDISTMGGTVHVIFELFLMGLVQIAITTILMFLSDWRLAFIIIAIVPFSLILSSFIAAKSHKYHRRQHDRQGELYSQIEETYDNFATVKAFAIESQRSQSHQNINNELAKSERTASLISGFIEPSMRLMQAISFAALCLVGGYIAIKNNSGVGKIVEMILYSQLFARPIYSISGAIGNFQRTRAAAERVYSILEQDEMPPSEGEMAKAEGNVVFEDVCFSYVEGAPVIKNLSLNVQKGQKVAIVGPTGGGKTTIVNLLMRFYDIDSGRILIDGQDISKVSRESLRSNIGMVLQDTWLFKGTLRANIAYGKPDAFCIEVEDAARRAYCDHFIRTLPQGYDTEIDENALNVSGGQKQLITIARALLANRAILVLDEATSNVDTRTEILIQKAMDELTNGRTSFVIAHRLSTIIDADLILVVDKGEIVEQGTHTALLEKKGFYYNLYHSQYNI